MQHVKIYNCLQNFLLKNEFCVFFTQIILERKYIFLHLRKYYANSVIIWKNKGLIFTSGQDPQ